MVAKIKSGKSLIGAVNYNERKVSRGLAKLIAAVRYPKDIDKLNFYDKLLRLSDLTARNERTKTNTVHISLNFPNSENLPDHQLTMVAQDYMRGIGFEGQPYLLYRHEDAGHPHCHIVTTNIKSDGSRISLHYLGQNASEKARKAIEVKYGLTKAEEQKQKPSLKLNVQAVEYGKAETKRAITNVVNYIVRAYKFTSIPELNAVLQQYHVLADQGAKDSRMYARGGLIYWILDKQGNKTGVPIKASSIYGQPTLKTLEGKFILNTILRKPYKQSLIDRIDQVLAKPQSPDSFIEGLHKLQVTAVLRRNDEGRIYGTTFIDQRNKVVFNGSDLGKSYSANLLSTQFVTAKPTEVKTSDDQTTTPACEQALNNDNEWLDVLFTPEQQDLAALNKFKKKKRKRLNL